jgi:hypothetical protein
MLNTTQVPSQMARASILMLMSVCTHILDKAKVTSSNNWYSLFVNRVKNVFLTFGITQTSTVHLKADC